MMNQLIPQAVPTPIPQPMPPVMHDDEVDLAAYLDTFLDNRWLIAGIVLVITLLGVAYAFVAKPVYEASMLVQVEESSPNQSNNLVGEIGSTYAVKTAAIAEMELLGSRLVVSSAVDNLQLYITAQPKYFPLVGATLASFNKQLSDPGIFGHGGYAWGSESIKVSKFNVPDSLQNRDFVLTAEGNGKYRLGEEEHAIALQGRVGSALDAGTGAGRIELQVENLAAKPGTEFLLKRASRLSTIESVQKSLIVAEPVKQSGVIAIKLQGQNPQLTNDTLKEIGQEYLRQNAARRTEEAEKSLAFLNKQLPDLKQKLEQSESKYNKFRNSHNTFDLGEEARVDLQQSAAAKVKRSELLQKKTELLVGFTQAHPLVMGVDAQLREINAQIKSIDGHLKSFPDLQQEELRLTRDIKVTSDLYSQLLATAQQLSLIAVGKVSNVRLIDNPMVPEKPVKPNRPLVIALTALTGLFLGMIGVLIKKSLKREIDDPRIIEKTLGVPVYATIPHSKKLRDLYKKVSAKSQKIPLLAHVSSTDGAIESLRTFRTALQFSMLHATNNIVQMSGATPGLGKSFVSVNLAAIIATSGKRVLLIDADLRSGHLHQYFSMGRSDGLSEVISGEMQLDQVIHRGAMENLDFISTGRLPLNPSELLLRPNFGMLLQSLSASYDLILIDSAPILAASDAIIVGSHAGTIYIMSRAGVSTVAEIKESLKRLNQAGLAAKGVLFNDLKPRSGRYGYGYGYGNKEHAEYAFNEKSLIKVSSKL
ncbi:polysaccharide biosynthesis tyrosine autokinase [Herminiimonas sp. CN]|uniref:polysaccharide biosynthesis tyrosine autokinase n=1 Tax=Herminiimonas sp. CN TaxID=1349818 RepID=UPI001EE65086|nr:polysaccharide biosynthesis tyrosine autokinase [Herminiimonas sp. CN]